nr:MAG TPA: hypothetical protein [Caudoviricetes sp.]
MTAICLEACCNIWEQAYRPRQTAGRLNTHFFRGEAARRVDSEVEKAGGNR